MGVFFLFLVLIWCDPHPIGLYCALIQKDKQFHNFPLSLIHVSPFLFSLYCCEGIRWCQNSSGWRHLQSQVQFIWLSHLEETHNILTMEVVERFRDGERKLVQGCDLFATNRQRFIYPDVPFQSDLEVTEVLQDAFSGLLLYSSIYIKLLNFHDTFFKCKWTWLIIYSFEDKEARMADVFLEEEFEFTVSVLLCKNTAINVDLKHFKGFHQPRQSFFNVRYLGYLWDCKRFHSEECVIWDHSTKQT